MIRPLGLLCLLAACTTTPSSPEPVRTDVEAVRKTPGDPGEVLERKAEFARTLIVLDKRVDRFVYLSSQPGTESRAERNLIVPALVAQVAEYEKELFEAAADAGNAERRRVAVKALGFSDDPAAVGILEKALEAKGDARLLTNATFALARIGSPSTRTGPLLDLLKDPDADVRSNSLLALWKVFDARREIGASAVDPVEQGRVMTLLEGLLYDPNDAVIRANAAAAMGALGHPDGLTPLLDLLRDEQPLVRTQTAIALSKIGDDRAVPALIAALETSKSFTAKQAVALALTAIFERKGVKVPANLGDEPRAWERFARQHYAEQK